MEGRKKVRIALLCFAPGQVTGGARRASMRVAKHSLVRGDVFTHILGRIRERHSVGLAVVSIALHMMISVVFVCVCMLSMQSRAADGFCT